MPVNKYEAFLKAAELGSLTRAAAELGVTQSAVSHMIGTLEEELGFSLLKRGRSGARPTAEGEQVLPAIRGMLNSREQLEQTAAAIRGLDCGTVRIGTFTSVAVHWLPGMIKRFQALYPKVELKLMNGDYHDVEQWLSDGSCDLGFVALPTKQRGRVTALLEDRLLAVVPRDHRLASLPQPARDQRPRRTPRPGGCGRHTQHTVYDEGRLRHNCDGGAGPGREHHAGTAALRAQRQRPRHGAHPAGEPHHRPLSPGRGQGRTGHSPLRRLCLRLGTRTLFKDTEHLVVN